MEKGDSKSTARVPWLVENNGVSNAKTSEKYSFISVRVGTTHLRTFESSSQSSRCPDHDPGVRWLLFLFLLVMHDIPSLTRQSSGEEQERLLGQGIEWEEMADRSHDNKDLATMDSETSYRTGMEPVVDPEGAAEIQEDGQGQPVYRVYKRRWFGLMQLVLMNIIVSWDVSSLRNSLPYRLHR